MTGLARSESTVYNDRQISTQKSKRGKGGESAQRRLARAAGWMESAYCNDIGTHLGLRCDGPEAAIEGWPPENCVVPTAADVADR